MALKRIIWPRAPLLIECVCVCVTTLSGTFLLPQYIAFSSSSSSSPSIPCFMPAEGSSRKTAQGVAFLSVLRCALIGGHGVTGWRGVGRVGMEGVGVSAGVGTWE